VIAGPDPLELPVPGLVVLVGASGAGKSTLAGRLFAADEVISSDGLREAVGGDAADHRTTRTAFGILHREVRGRLAARRLVVVDATNVEPGARASLRRAAAMLGVPAVAIVLAMDPAEVHARNAARPGRVVPPGIVDRHLVRMAGIGADRAAIETALRREGFAVVRVLATTDELDALRVIRRVSAAPASPSGATDRDPLSRP
jgi:predicted kinase